MIGTSSSKAQYFNGDVPIAQSASLRVQEDTLLIGLADSQTCRWPLQEIRLVADGAGKDLAVLRWTGDPLARLVTDDAALMAQMPRLTRSAPPKGRGRLAAWAVAAVAAVALQIGVLVPLLADNLAPFIPPKGERALGEATFGHIRNALDETGLNPIEICEAPPGVAALDQLTAKLTGFRPMEHEISVFVLDHPMVNAFALPGGFVVLFRGLIDAAEDPDEVAAVLGHEIGHVVSRDPTRHALRSAGSIGVLGLLLGDFAGGAAVLLMAERLIAASYTQEAEAGADRYAQEILSAAEITPAALAALFETMRAKNGEVEGVVAHFLSHPSLGERILAARQAVDPDVRYGPSMPAEDWKALQDICG